MPVVQLNLTDKEQRAYVLLKGLGYIGAAADILNLPRDSYSVMAKAVLMHQSHLYGLSRQVNGIISDQTLEDLEMLVDLNPECRHLRKCYVEPPDYCY